jgi:hypothetical protein
MPEAVRAELVEALSFSRRKRLGEPFDKLGANAVGLA